MNPTKPTLKKAMLEALEKSLGVVTSAAKSVGINRSSHYEWIKSDSEYKKEVESIDNVSLDFAESQLFKQIQEGNTSATIFYLKTKGKKRGYVERQEIAGVQDAPLKIDIKVLGNEEPITEETDE
jgi:hypothetical protein